MPLVSICGELKKAQQGRYAVPLFNTFDTHSTEGILAAFAEKRAPGIIGVYSGMLQNANCGPFVAYVRAMAAQSPVPVALMLDHGHSLEDCVRAIALGFTDVMFDSSKLPLEENIARTRLVVQVAHAVGVSVEAELGHVGDGRTYQSFGALGKGFTDQTTVERYIAETGVDSLAIAFGTAHGHYEGTPRLDLDLLAAIRHRIDVPLAMHGGSELPDDLFRAAIAGGICKINVFTDLATTAAARVRDLVPTPDLSYFAIGSKIREAFRERCIYHLDLFGTSGKADM